MCDSEASPASRVRIGSLPRRYDAVDGQRLRHPGVEAGPYHGDQATTHIHHAGEEAFVCLEGDLSVTIEGTRTRVPPGGYVIVPRGAPHTFATPGGAHVLAVMSPEIADLIQGIHADLEEQQRSELWERCHSSLVG